MADYPANRPFAGKLQRIQEQYEYFWRQEAARIDVDAYKNRTRGHKYNGGPLHPKWIQEKTHFTDKKDGVFAESENALLIGNLSSPEVSQYGNNPGRAGMSLIHILGIPKANIFNGVSLDASDVGIIDEMINLFKTEWEENLQFREAVVAHQITTIEKLAKESQDGIDPKAMTDHFINMDISRLTADDFAFGFHLWPDNSIGHLHLHIIAAPPEYRQYSTHLHDDKTKDALEVRDFILSRTST